MNESKIIGSRIRYFRKAQKMSLQKLADLIHKSKASVSKYESGQVPLDVEVLYDIAAALKVTVDQLLYYPAVAEADLSGQEIPAFFRGQNRIYTYIYDGRIGSVRMSVIDIILESGLFRSTGIEAEHGDLSRGVPRYEARMYLNPQKGADYHFCEQTYHGHLTHYGALSNFVFQNLDMAMEQYIISVPTPYLDDGRKWGLAFGISARPLMPTANKILLTKNEIHIHEELTKELKVSKEDIRLLKHYNMLTV